MKRAIRPILAISAALIVLWLVVPTTDIVSPDWDVVVTDTHGDPLAGVNVSDDSQQYTIESRDTEVTKITDDTGHVHFDERTIHANGLMRAFGVLRNLDQGAHASFGVHTSLYAVKSGYGQPAKLEIFGQNEREGRANGAKHQSAHLILQDCPPGYNGIGCSFPDDTSKPPLPLHQNDDLP